jgi:hypothetical protein
VEEGVDIDELTNLRIDEFIDGLFVRMQSVNS